MIKAKKILYTFFLLSFFGKALASEDATFEFPFQPPKEMILIANLEALHHPTSTKNVEAQRFFDQGLTLWYASNQEAAYWFFQKASLLDSEFAMAYWGMALALGLPLTQPITPLREKKAHEIIHKALEFAVDVTENERDYIEALTKRYSHEPSINLLQLAKDYHQAMLLVKHKYPDDLDAAVLHVKRDRKSVV